jgi:hypothetical protein
VLALTYEDMNCTAAGGYDSTALAILTGIRNQLFGPTAIADGGERPRQFKLAQNYPNPFNPSTTIRYEVPVASAVRVQVFDALGRLVATLLDAEQQPGRHEVRFDALGRASGVYLVRLTAPSHASTRRILLMK